MQIRAGAVKYKLGLEPGARVCARGQETQILVLESLFNKVAGIQASNFIKKRLLTQVFSCKKCEIFKNSFFYKTPPVATFEEMNFLTNWIPVLSLTANYFGKQTIFSNKNNYGTSIKLVEGDEISSDNEKTAQELNNFFQNAVSNLNIRENSFI